MPEAIIPNWIDARVIRVVQSRFRGRSHDDLELLDEPRLGHDFLSFLNCIDESGNVARGEMAPGYQTRRESKRQSRTATQVRMRSFGQLVNVH